LAQCLNFDIEMNEAIFDVKLVHDQDGGVVKVERSKVF
jgi:hypothetical protein